VISRFIIDRPVFAIVLSLAIVLAGGAGFLRLPLAQDPDVTPPTVMVTCQYPGASAGLVVDTVAALIEQQVHGIAKMMYMSSVVGNDGSYTLTVTFDIGTDANTALVVLQDRVALAMPQLPSQVQDQGVTIRKKTPDRLMIVNLFSPDGRYDDIYLSNYARIQVQPEIARLPGVSDVTLSGRRDSSMQIWLDPNKLAFRNLTSSDVVDALSQQNIQVAAGQVGPLPVPTGLPFPLTITMLGPAPRCRAVPGLDPQGRRPGRVGPAQGCGPRRASRPER
jgi:multidrug efflux pump